MMISQYPVLGSRRQPLEVSSAWAAAPLALLAVLPPPPLLLLLLPPLLLLRMLLLSVSFDART